MKPSGERACGGGGGGVGARCFPSCCLTNPPHHHHHPPPQMWSELNNAATHRRGQIHLQNRGSACSHFLSPFVFSAWEAEEEILVLLQEPCDRARQGAVRTRQPLSGGTTALSEGGAMKPCQESSGPSDTGKPSEAHGLVQSRQNNSGQ